MLPKLVAYRLLDLVSAYSHFLTTIYGNYRMVNGEKVQQTKTTLINLSNEFGDENNPFHLFLEGYFGIDSLGYNLNALFKQFIELSCCGIIEPLYDMDRSIVELLMVIEKEKLPYRDISLVQKEKKLSETTEFVCQAI